MPATSVHLNGSVNLPDAETVMREISARVPTGVRRTVDGETGDRRMWIMFQHAKLAEIPQLESAVVRENPEGGRPFPQFRLAAGVAADDIEWPDLGYCNAYCDSFETFSALRKEGVIGPDTRFQMQYPTPVGALASAVVADDLEAIAASYERALFADLARMLARLPHDQIAVQWDVATEFTLMSGIWWFKKTQLEELTPQVARSVDAVPDDVPVGLHLCYGDREHEHISQPMSFELQVRLTNSVLEKVQRPVNFISFTIPQDRQDEAYFAPLRAIRTDASTELAFPIVPYFPDRQQAGTTEGQVRLIESELAASPGGPRDWAICCECGLGRVAPADLPKLLDLHRELLAIYQ